MRMIWIGLGLLTVAFVPMNSETVDLSVGSKKFTESVIIGELVTQLGLSADIDTVHKKELGGTSQLFQSLLAGDIDIYPDYTGTIRLELLAKEQPHNMEEARTSWPARMY